MFASKGLAEEKSVALSFDDSPKPSSVYFSSLDRTKKLIEKLRASGVPSVAIFANPCNGKSEAQTYKQLKLYRDNGHFIGNHTCSHPRLDDVGPEEFISNIQKAEDRLGDLLSRPKMFRYPFLNEGTHQTVRDKVRQWLANNKYRNAQITGDNEDPTFSSKIHTAKKLGKKIDYGAVKALFVDHIVSALECNHLLAFDSLNMSPKHVLLLHEADATVMFIDSLIDSLKDKGWKIISPIEAYSDPIYSKVPKNTHSGFGLISQLVYEKTGEKKICYDYKKMVGDLNKILDL